MRRAPAILLLFLVGVVLVAGVVLGPATPARAQADPDDGDDIEFTWDDESMREAFAGCMQLVDWVANGREGSPPVPIYDFEWGPWDDDDPFPGGVDQETWHRAIDEEWHDGVRIQEFTYQPKCHTLLPDDYTDRIPTRFLSDAYDRCRQNVDTRQAPNRPDVVPDWYWEVSLELGDCYLMLPLGAFGIGDGDQDENAWSDWTTDDEVEYPDEHENPDVNAAVDLCYEFTTWRMDGGDWDGNLPGEYEEGPSVLPSRIWHEAINFYADADSGGGTWSDVAGETIPSNWNPNCRLLLLYEECEPDDETLLPELCLGPHATSNYDIGFSQYDSADDDTDDTAALPSVSRNLWGGMTGLTFQIGKGAVQVALWMVDWSLNFDIREYDALALGVGDRYQDGLLGLPGLHLRELFWLVLVVWAGFMALRGRVAVAGAEILTTIVLLMLAGVLMAEREMYLTSVWDLMDDASTSLLVAGTEADADQSSGTVARDELILDTQQAIHRVFVEQPYDHLNWGRSLGDPNDSDNSLQDCAAARYHIVAMGPHGADPWPRQQMEDLGGDKCADLVEFNRDPTGTRFVGAVLVMTSSILVAVLLGLVGLTIVIAKFVALLLFAVVPFVVPLTILPGGGRRLAWAWVTTLMQVIAAVVAMSFLLSLVLLTLTELNELTADVPIIERFLLMNLVVMVVFAARRSVLSGGQSFAAHLREHLSTTRGAGTTWAGSTPTRGGVNLAGIDRRIGMTAAGPAVATWQRSVAMRRARYTARLGYRNLKAVSRWKQARNLRNARWVDRRINGLKLDRPLDAPARRHPLP